MDSFLCFSKISMRQTHVVQRHALTMSVTNLTADPQRFLDTINRFISFSYGPIPYSCKGPYNALAQPITNLATYLQRPLKTTKSSTDVPDHNKLQPHGT
jgi:hypothetical protein